MCYAIGDCGVKKNYINVDGDNFWEELFSGDVKKSSIPNGKSHGGGISDWWVARLDNLKKDDGIDQDDRAGCDERGC